MIFIGINNIFQLLIVLYDREIYVEKEILGNFDINSKLGFLISGVVNSLDHFLGYLKAPGGYQKVCFFLRRKSNTILTEGINIRS